MAETWEVIIWVIVSIVLLIMFIVIIASILAWRKKNRRKKNSRRKGLEWGKEDKIDSRKKVHYNVKRGDVKILDEPDSGVQKSHEKKVKYNARTEEANISDVGKVDSGNTAVGQLTEKKLVEENVFNGRNKGSSEAYKENDKQSSFAFEEKTQSNVSFSESKHNAPEVHTDISSLRNERKRLQPVKLEPAAQNGNITHEAHRSVNNRANLGYSEANQVNSYQAPTIQFQQPAAIVRAFVHPGPTKRFEKTKSLPRNFSKSSRYKKTYSSTKTQHKPISYNWSLVEKTQHRPQSSITVPIRYKVKRPSRQSGVMRTSQQRSSDVAYSTVRDDSELEWDSDYNRWKYRSLPYRRSRRNWMRRSFKKRQERRQATSRPTSRLATTTRGAPSKEPGYEVASRPSPALNDMIYITNSPVATGVPTRHYDPSLKNNQHYQREVQQAPSVSEKRDESNYYKENYKMVKRSEFPGKPSSREPDMVSISSSEFSEYLMGPPRPTDNTSDDNESWQGMVDGRAKNWGKYTHGSYKEYGGARVQTIDKKVSKELERERETSDDRVRHSTSFQDTLENLKNGNGRDSSSVKIEVTGDSPWLNNDNTFRREHGVPHSGVAVLPPRPVFVQTETAESDSSDDNVRKGK